jgi:hypothetical protein
VNKFEDLNDRFASLGIGMTRPNKFRGPVMDFTHKNNSIYFLYYMWIFGARKFASMLICCFYDNADLLHLPQGYIHQHT